MSICSSCAKEPLEEDGLEDGKEEEEQGFSPEVLTPHILLKFIQFEIKTSQVLLDFISSFTKIFESANTISHFLVHTVSAKLDVITKGFSHDKNYASSQETFYLYLENTMRKNGKYKNMEKWKYGNTSW